MNPPSHAHGINHPSGIPTGRGGERWSVAVSGHASAVDARQGSWTRLTVRSRDLRWPPRVSIPVRTCRRRRSRVARRGCGRDHRRPLLGRAPGTACRRPRPHPQRRRAGRQALAGRPLERDVAADRPVRHGAGDAEQVIVLEALGDRSAKLEKTGNIDDEPVIDAVIKIMEGGRECTRSKSTLT